MSHAVSKSVKLTPVSAMFRAAYMVGSFGCPRSWCHPICSRSDVTDAGARCSLPAAMAVVGIAGVAVVVADRSPIVIVGAKKDVVTVEVEAAPIVPPLIRRAP